MLSMKMFYSHTPETTSSANATSANEDRAVPAPDRTGVVHDKVHDKVHDSMETTWSTTTTYPKNSRLRDEVQEEIRDLLARARSWEKSTSETHTLLQTGDVEDPRSGSTPPAARQQAQSSRQDLLQKERTISGSEKYHEFLARYAVELKTLAAHVAGPNSMLLGGRSTSSEESDSAEKKNSLLETNNHLVETSRILERYAEHIGSQAVQAASHVNGGPLSEVSESDLAEASMLSTDRQQNVDGGGLLSLLETKKSARIQGHRTLIFCAYVLKGVDVQTHVPWWTQGPTPSAAEQHAACSHARYEAEREETPEAHQEEENEAVGGGPETPEAHQEEEEEAAQHPPSDAPQHHPPRDATQHPPSDAAKRLAQQLHEALASTVALGVMGSEMDQYAASFGKGRVEKGMRFLFWGYVLEDWRRTILLRGY